MPCSPLARIVHSQTFKTWHDDPRQHLVVRLSGGTNVVRVHVVANLQEGIVQDEILQSTVGREAYKKPLERLGVKGLVADNEMP